LFMGGELGWALRWGRGMGVCVGRGANGQKIRTLDGGYQGGKVRVIMFWGKWQNSAIIRDRDQD